MLPGKPSSEDNTRGVHSTRPFCAKYFPLCWVTWASSLLFFVLFSPQITSSRSLNLVCMSFLAFWSYCSRFLQYSRHILFGQEMGVHVNLFLAAQPTCRADEDSSSSLWKIFHANVQHKSLPTAIEMYSIWLIQGVLFVELQLRMIHEEAFFCSLFPSSFVQLLYNGNPILMGDV